MGISFCRVTKINSRFNYKKDLPENNYILTTYLKQETKFLNERVKLIEENNDISIGLNIYQISKNSYRIHTNHGVRFFDFTNDLSRKELADQQIKELIEQEKKIGTNNLINSDEYHRLVNRYFSFDSSLPEKTRGIWNFGKTWETTEGILSYQKYEWI